MEPDATFHARRAAEEEARLSAIAATMGPADWERTAAEAAELLRRQATPDAPEALACIPTLQLSDVPLQTAPIPRSVVQAPLPAPSPPFVHLLHEQPSAAGIGYSTLYFDLSPLPQTLLPLVPLFSWALAQCGTAALDETELAHRIGTVTGGVGASPSVMEVPGGWRDTALPFLYVSGKALAPQVLAMGELISDILRGARLDVRPRLLTHLRDAVAGHESGLVTGGGRYASSLLASHFSKAGWVSDAMGGLGAFHAQRALLTALQVRWRRRPLLLCAPTHLLFLPPPPLTTAGPRWRRRLCRPRCRPRVDPPHPPLPQRAHGRVVDG